ncbi:uncharacterized protein LOC122259281 [Penaeus japonicus]|uniref:uncharacterized protein LOC122259281 n=1 Tax=Penaeus japonicus TaxID=27405 RepID=UPI001C710B0B|nr:uncharacterized protein LOC122259281 [Penaeus japonicus]
MASGAAIGVTVVGVVAIVGLLGLLGRYLGLWTWAWTWIRASREEKVKLCRSERTTSGRSYLFDNDLDWIGLWPRTGSYKRFTNLDDVTSMVTLDESVRPPEEPDLPPQPLRPAPAPPPSRMPGGWTDSGEGSPSPASSSIGLGAGVETPGALRPAPVLDRRDSEPARSAGGFRGGTRRPGLRTRANLTMDLGFRTIISSRKQTSWEKSKHLENVLRS